MNKKLKFIYSYEYTNHHPHPPGHLGKNSLPRSLQQRPGPFHRGK